MWVGLGGESYARDSSIISPAFYPDLFSYELLKTCLFCFPFIFLGWRIEARRKVEFCIKNVSTRISFSVVIQFNLFWWNVNCEFGECFRWKMFSSVLRGLGAAKSVLFRAQLTSCVPPVALTASVLQLQQKCSLHLSPISMWVTL